MIQEIILNRCSYNRGFTLYYYQDKEFVRHTLNPVVILEKSTNSDAGADADV